MYKFIYPYENFTQTAFDGHEFKVRGYRGEGHIIRVENGITLCGLSKEDVKDSIGNIATLENRLTTVKLCPKCQEVWKNLPDSPWKKWTEMVKE